MKTELKRRLFDTSIGFCNFVNEYKITKENIQSIVEIDGAFALFYWEITVKEEINHRLNMIKKMEKI